MRHVIDYRPPWERKRRRPWAPGETPPPPPTSPVPGGNVRILSALSPASGGRRGHSSLATAVGIDRYT